MGPISVLVLYLLFFGQYYCRINVYVFTFYYYRHLSLIFLYTQLGSNLR